MKTTITKFEVGQVWQEASGRRVELQRRTSSPGESGALICSDGYFYDEKTGECYGMPSRNLVTLYTEAPANPVIGQDAANDANVGDINSTAKGSGARYNAGKPPYDLVPLQMMADYYAMGENSFGEPVFDPILALSYLGAFQAGGDSDDLLVAMQYLGDGWADCAQVFEYGRRKYAAWNWSKGMAWSVPIACAARHLLAMIKGEEFDPESGKPHRGHAYCNFVMLYTFFDIYQEGDDRPPAGSLAIGFDGDHQVETDEPEGLDLSALLHVITRSQPQK